MDPVTQGLLGAAIGAACCQKRLGRSALLWGAVGGVLPDIDGLAGRFGQLTYWEWHRGPTHALWFGPVVGPLLGEGLWRYYRWRDRRRRQRDIPPPPDPRGLETARPAWWLLMTLALLSHPLLDLCTHYGTQLLSPFSNLRFAIPAVPVIELIYSGMLVLGVLFAALWPARARSALVGVLLVSTAWLGYGWYQNSRAETLAQAELGPEWRVAAYPTLLQPWLRRVTAVNGSDWRIGYVSTWAPGPIPWAEVETLPGVVEKMVETLPDAKVFYWFAMGQLAALPAYDDSGAVDLWDLRYGVPDFPDRSFWGLRILVDPDGNPVGPAITVRPERRMDGQVFNRVADLVFNGTSGRSVAELRVMGEDER